ncbi:MAG: hypothetical protein IJF17_11270 [Thermoguttaceae bacterium]|nr:hypothetical protein [Thermoguttaceae bacterium]
MKKTLILVTLFFSFFIGRTVSADLLKEGTLSVHSGWKLVFEEAFASDRVWRK